LTTTYKDGVVTAIRLVAKFVELLALGVVIGLLSIGLSFLWQEYKYKTSDLAQYAKADLLPNQPLKVPLVVIDIGDDTCKEWTDNNYGGECAFLPRLPHAKLERVFLNLFPKFMDSKLKPKPKLVVVDIDLRPEEAKANPFDPNVNDFNESEKRIRSTVEQMVDIPLLVAQPLLRIPKQGNKQLYEYAAVGTILHKLDKPKPDLRFGQVEQDLGSDSVLRRFPATIQLFRPDTLDPDPRGINRKEHLALKVCELVSGPNLCGGSPDIRSGFVQFQYRLARNVDQLADLNVKVIEARAVLADSFDASILDNAIVILGSTARGRGDYHFTPLDVVSGETAGVIVVANEVVAALEGRWLQDASLKTELVEKGFLLLISTTFIVLVFWLPWLRRDTRVRRSLIVGFLSWLLWTTYFAFAAFIAIAINLTLSWYIFFEHFDLGVVADPVTPVVAAVLDIVVDVCAAIGRQVGLGVDKLLNHLVPLLRALRLRFLIWPLVIIYFNPFLTTWMQARADSGGSIASIKDVDPLNIQINIIHSTGIPKRGGPGTSINIGDTVSIRDWCAVHRAGHVVIAGSVGTRLDCGGEKEHTFTEREAAIPAIPLSIPPRPTTSTITGENPGSAPTIAVSPNRVPDQSTTSPSPGQSPQIEDLLRKGAEPPSAK
jgi:CHASE2 domain